MRCCAILVNYFGASDTAAAAWSVRADQADVALLVVDNSADSAEQETLKRLLPEDAVVICAPANLGFGRACNIAFTATSHDFVFSVNPDVRVLPGCLGALLNRMQANAQLGAVAPRQYLDDACHWQLPPSWFPTSLRVWATAMALRNKERAKQVGRATRVESLRLWTVQQPIPQRALSGGAVLIRRSAIPPMEYLFDPQFFMYFEDSDLCRRLKGRGYRMEVVPSARAVHRWRNQAHKAGMMDTSAQLYFAKYRASGGVWRERETRCVAQAVLPSVLGKAQDFPVGGVEVPTAWQGGWLLELALSPLLSPAIGYQGIGAWAARPDDVLAHFEGATVFARLGPMDADFPVDNCHYFELKS